VHAAAAGAEEYAPAPHARQAETPDCEEKVPDWHEAHAPSDTKLPGAHDRQKLPDPSALVPALQFWHAVLLPSTKYWPPPQHTAAPSGVQ
jgi:hypothetical protein